MKIEIKKFGIVLVSRPTGREAWLAYQPTLADIGENEHIDVDFDGVDVLTPSWADEFLTPLIRKYSGRITIVHSDNASVRETLKILGYEKDEN